MAMNRNSDDEYVTDKYSNEKREDSIVLAVQSWFGCLVAVSDGLQNVREWVSKDVYQTEQ